MKKRSLISLTLLLSAASLFAQSSKKSFDFGWKFCEEDIASPQVTNFDNGKWKNVNLPHDWDIYHAPFADAPTVNGGGYYPAGIGWYVKQVKDTELKTVAGESVWLHFEGVYQNAEVFVNGERVATHAYGYTPFKVNITKNVRKGLNSIAVRVDNSKQPNCRWYSGSGIYRHVWLEKFNENKMDDPDKLFITTEKIYGMSADGTHADSADIRITYADKLNEKRVMKDVKLWSPKHPNLYNIKVGELTVKHGIRTFSYDAENGFVLNGQPMILNGACVHHDNGIIGSMSFDAAEVRKVDLMKYAGFNLIRTSHNPQSRAFYDACDSLGMLVVDEIFDGWRTQKNPYDYHLVIDSCYNSDITSWVLRDRNHPSIIAYSIGNEVIERKDIRVVHTAKLFKNAILAHDKTRPVTEALCAWDRDWEIYDPHADVLDIVGYNYMMHKAESDHERDPKRVMWQTESYPRDAFNNWKHTVERPYIIGDMVWTGLDYLGESSIGTFHYEGEPREESWMAKHFPIHGTYCGDVDLIGWRKPIAHYRDMLWNQKEGDASIYMAVKEPDYYYKGHVSETMWSVWPTWESWNWKGWEGKDIEVELYTKAPQVSLYLNDKLVETRKVSIDTQYKATIKLPYQPGVLKAVAQDANGKSLAHSIMGTSGKPYTVILKTDQETIAADGQDLSYVYVEVVDEAGNRVPDASLPLDVKVTGQGTLLAAGSADVRDIEPTTSPRVTTYKGLALIVVRSAGKKGKATVSVSGANLKSATHQIIVK